MKNKNALYIVLGIGAGVVAYYLFCKKKNEEKVSGEPDAKAEDKPTPSKAVSGGFGGGSVISAPAMPKFVTPSATTTPLVVNVTSTPSATPSRSDLTTISNPISSPVIASATPSRSDLTTLSSDITKPATSPVTSPVIASATPSRSDLTTLSSDVTKPATSPITTPTTTTATTTTATTTTPLKTSSFEGIGQQCFEVGECLYDL